MTEKTGRGKFQASEQARLNKAALSMLIVALVTVAGPFWYFVNSREDSAFLTFLILVLPSVLIAFGATSLLLVEQRPPLLTLGIVLSEATKNVLVSIYMLAIKNHFTPAALKFLSWTALAVGSFLVLMVFRLTAWIMRYTVERDGAGHADNGQRTDPEQDNPEQGSTVPTEQLPRHGVIQQLLRHRFLSICGLLVAFLHLTIFLAFAVAFYDLALAEKTHAGIRSGLALKRTVPRFDAAKDTVESPGSASGAAEPSETVTPIAEPLFLLTFHEGSASLQCSRTVDASRIDAAFFEDGSAQTWRIDQLKNNKLVPRGCEAEIQELAWNVRELHRLEGHLKQLYAHDSFDRYRGFVISHASENMPRSGFGSNYEISRARAEQTEEYIESMLARLQRDSEEERAPFNLEWLLLPAGNGSASLLFPDAEKLGRLKEAKLTRNLSAEIKFLHIPGHLTALQRRAFNPTVQRVQGNELMLLDYLYFMVTTAGYGDLIPTTGFVQFIATTANIFELFFLVVAFNVILAFRREPLGARIDARSSKPTEEEEE